MLINSAIITAPGSFTCDLLVNAIGYEDRARFSVESTIVSAQRCLSIAFENRGLFGYSRNMEAMERIGSSIFDWDGSQLERGDIGESIDALIAELGPSIRIAVDISSMNRSMMSAVFRSLIRNHEAIHSAHVLYAPATFRAPDHDYPQIGQIGPVAPELSGYMSEPSFPVGLLIGLGYEFGIAAGIMNRLEPKLAIAFRAIGNDPRYEEAVRTANFDFAFGLARCDVTDYSLLRPDLAAGHVENILSAMTRQYRCVLVPMGPKLLSAIFILAGYRFLGHVAVWRVSEIGNSPHNASADGRLVKCEIDLARTFTPQIRKDLSELYSVTKAGDLALAN